MIKRISLLFFFIMIFLLFLTQCQKKDAADKDQARRGGTIKIGLIGSIDDLFPFTLTEYYAQVISGNLLNPPLTDSDAEGDPIPFLASGWQLSQDKRTIRYLINRDYFWQNGQPLTAADVKATYAFIKKFKDRINPIYKPEYEGSATIIDSFVVQFSFEQPLNDLNFHTRFPIMNARQLQDVDDFSTFRREYAENFIGCGQYVLSGRQSGHIVLQRNNAFAGRQPYADSIEFVFFDDSERLIAALIGHQIHFVQSIPLTEVNRIAGLSDYRIETGNQHGFTFIGWNLNKPALQSAKIRKALTYALDRNTLVDGVLSGYARVQDVPAYPDFWAYHNTEALPYDPLKAAELLGEAGWTRRGTSGYLEKNGKPFELNILTNEESDIRSELAVNIRACYQALGIKTKLENVPWKVLLDRLQSADFDAVLISWLENGPYNLAELFHSKQIDQGNNFMNYSNSRVDGLLDRALNNEDKEKRRASWIEFQKIIIRERPITVLFNQNMISIISEKLKNVDPRRNDFIRNVGQWYLQE